jgi:hypothetical protein
MSTYNHLVVSTDGGTSWSFRSLPFINNLATALDGATVIRSSNFGAVRGWEFERYLYSEDVGLSWHAEEGVGRQTFRVGVGPFPPDVRLVGVTPDLLFFNGGTDGTDLYGCSRVFK